MDREEQLKAFRLEREELSKNLESLYSKTFDRISHLELGERTLAKLTQLILHSRDGALNPLREEVEKPLITSPPVKP